MATQIGKYCIRLDEYNMFQVGEIGNPVPLAAFQAYRDAEYYVNNIIKTENNGEHLSHAPE